MNIESSDPRRLPMTDQEVLAEGLLSVGEACDFLSIGRSLLYELMDRRVLDNVKLGSRRLIPKRALVEVAVRGLTRGVSTL